MSRRARVHCPGGVFHVVSRFARDEWWLDRKGAREAYLRCLGHALDGTDAQCLAYCLMSNHVHLVVVQGNEPLSRLTKSAHTAFVQWARQSTRRRKALGPVFAGRPFMRLVESEHYLLDLVRYVHNNPVRAGQARTARTSTWSSHRAYIGLDEQPEWLRSGFVLSQFGKRASSMSSKFDRFVDDARNEERRPEFSGGDDAREAAAARTELGDGHQLSGGVLGSDAFVSRVRRDEERIQQTLSSIGREMAPGRLHRPSLAKVVAETLVYLEVDPWELEQRPRAHSLAFAKRLVAWIWVQQYGGQQVEVARELRVTTGAVSQWFRIVMQDAPLYEEIASNIVSTITANQRPVARKQKALQSRVRFHVDMDD